MPPRLHGSGTHVHTRPKQRSGRPRKFRHQKKPHELVQFPDSCQAQADTFTLHWKVPWPLIGTVAATPAVNDALTVMPTPSGVAATLAPTVAENVTLHDGAFVDGGQKV